MPVSAALCHAGRARLVDILGVISSFETTMRPDAERRAGGNPGYYVAALEPGRLCGLSWVQGLSAGSGLLTEGVGTGKGGGSSGGSSGWDDFRRKRNSSESQKNGVTQHGGVKGAQLLMRVPSSAIPNVRGSHRPTYRSPAMGRLACPSPTR